MAGIFARSKYDSLFQEEITTQSVRPTYYSIDDNSWDNAKKCVSYNGPRSNRNGTIGEIDTGDRLLRVDVENMLARDYSDTKYTSGNTLEEKKKRLLETVSNFNPNTPDCDNYLDKNNSRLDGDNKIFRETAFDVTFTPIIDPREWVYNGYNETEGNNRYGRSTRYDTKIDLESAMAKIQNAAALK
jgi:hypothetical protein